MPEALFRRSDSGAARDAAGGARAAGEVGELAAVLGSLADETLGKDERRRLLIRVSALLATQARIAGARAVASGRWLGDLMVELGPHIPIRTAATLSAHHHGLTGEALADALEGNAANATTAIGAAAGAVAAAQWVVAPLLIAVPIEIMVETIAVATVEVKLLGELHAVYGVDIPGTGTQRGLAFVGAWSHRRGVDPWRPWTITAVVSAAGRARVTRRIMGRLGRNIGTLTPFLIGAFYAARSNRNETRRLSLAVRADLRVLGRRSLPMSPSPALPPGSWPPPMSPITGGG